MYEAGGSDASGVANPGRAQRCDRAGEPGAVCVPADLMTALLERAEKTAAARPILAARIATRKVLADAKAEHPPAIFSAAREPVEQGRSLVPACRIPLQDLVIHVDFEQEGGRCQVVTITLYLGKCNGNNLTPRWWSRSERAVHALDLLQVGEPLPDGVVGPTRESLHRRDVFGAHAEPEPHAVDHLRGVLEAMHVHRGELR